MNVRCVHHWLHMLSHGDWRHQYMPYYTSMMVWSGVTDSREYIVVYYIGNVSSTK